MLMKSAQDGRRYDAAHVLAGAMDRSVLVERPMQEGGSQAGWNFRKGQLTLGPDEGGATATIAESSARGTGMTKDEKFVIFASSLDTVFGWHDFYLYATLAPRAAKR